MPSVASVTKVLVTGFGSFGGIDKNPSWEIVSRLPQTLPNNIEVTVYPSAVPVAYHPVFNLVPQLYAETAFDLVLHIGVAAGRDYFAVEASSAQSVHEAYGYQSAPDVDNATFSVAEQAAAWGDLPVTLETDLDLDEVVELWQDKTSDIAFPPLGGEWGKNKRAGSPVEVKLVDDFSLKALGGLQVDVDAADPDGEVRWSDEVGFYLCGFIYYTGLAELGRTREGDLVFMHVPDLQSDEEIATGVEVATELINSLVESWRE